MHRATRLASAVLAAALSVGVTAPALAGKLEHPGGTHPAAAKNQSGKLLLSIDRLDRALARSVKDARLRRLPVADATAVKANVAADRAALAALEAEAATGSVTASDAARVKAYRPANYTVVVNSLRFAARLAAVVDAARAGDVAGAPEDAPLAEASGLVTAAVTAAREVTMASGKADLRAVKATLVQASALLGSVVGTGEEPTA